MRQRPATTNLSPPVNYGESRSTPTTSGTTLNERSSTLDYYQHNLAILEEDWTNQQQLSTPSSVSSSLFDMCRCCGRQDCDNLEYFNRTMKKLESDTRLAAEIGQGLLHKHETYVNESNQQRTQLEKQLEECHEKINGLENCLERVENQKDELLKEKNKWLWEYQKRQKILDETISDLEMANEKCTQLSLDLQSKSSELEKLRIFKFMVRHSEAREETLTSKLEDTNQELALCRKNELVLESKIKKLKMRYESLYNSHEQLTRDVEDKIIKNDTIVTTTHNTTADTFKLVSLNNNNNTNDLINLIKELSSANTKLKSDLLNCREQLSEAKGEVTALIIDQMDHSSTTPLSSLQDDMNSTTTKKTKVKRAASVKEKSRPSDSTVGRSKTIPIPLPPPLPTISSSMPTSSIMGNSSTSPPTSSKMSTSSSSAIVHHHYHYYVKNSKGERIQITDEMESGSGSDFSSSSSNESHHGEILLDCCDTAEKNDLYTAAALEQQQNNREQIILSPSTSSIITVTKDTSSTTNPYILLQEHVTQVLERLRGSDIRALNRRLKRAFDITELSSMSNSVIDNILMDVDTLETRFLWYNNNSEFFSLLDLFKDMLKELGILRTTMNELQVEYVNKVQQSQVRVEEEIIKKRELKRQQQQRQQVETTPLSWLTNMFKSSGNSENKEEDIIVTVESPTTPTPTTTTAVQGHYDRGSLLTKTTTDSSTLILSPDEGDHSHHQHHDLLRTTSSSNNKDQHIHINEPITVPITTRTTRNTFLSSSYTPTTSTARHLDKRRQQQPPNTPIPQMTPSNSTGTRTTIPPIIRNKPSRKRIHNNNNNNYAGGGSMMIPPPSTSSNSSTTNNFSSSWLGGK